MGGLSLGTGESQGSPRTTVVEEGGPSQGSLPITFPFQRRHFLHNKHLKTHKSPKGVGFHLEPSSHLRRQLFCLIYFEF